MAHYGWDTAGVTSGTLIDSARNAAGGSGFFWIRYCTPSPGASTIDYSAARAQSEIATLQNKNLNHYVLISEPSQSRLGYAGSTGTSYGQSDARRYGQAMQFVYNNVNQFWPGASCRIYAYLCMEGSSAITAAYWNAWDNAINAALLYSGYAPYLSGLYCKPNNGLGSCAHTSPYQLWSNNPEPCTACNGFGSVAWGPNGCSGVHTELWQMAIQDSSGACCGRSMPNVDFDMSNDDICNHFMWSATSNGC